jgi:di/tricarboxylate transporter
MIYVSASSAFLNNTPLVAMVMPYATNWAKRAKVSPSKLLIPLSYASILGGTATLIGTSTNLLMNGLIIEFNQLIDNGELIINGIVVESKLSELSIFDFSIVGVPMIFIGLLYFIFLGHKLLPEHRAVLESIADSPREYMVETIIPSNSNLIGKTMEEASLRNLDGLYVVEIIRGEEKITPVGPKEVLSEHDILLFAGDTNMIGILVDNRQGLKLPEKAFSGKLDTTEMLEVVIPYNSILSGKTVKASNFRGKLDASIVAIHRNSERLSGKIGEIALQPGDLLMLLCGPDFNKRIEGNNDLYVISKKNIAPVHYQKAKAISLISGLFIAILFSFFGWVSLFQSLILLLGLMVLTKTASLSEVKKSIRFNILVIAGMSLAIGRAMMKTETADLLANGVVGSLGDFGPIAVLFGVYLITNILAAYLTNVASLSIMLPIALGAALSLGLDYMPFILVVAFASAANFITPIGYQTNLMVFGPGRYSFNDYMKVGAPLSILYMLVAVFVLAFYYKMI